MSDTHFQEAPQDNTTSGTHLGQQVNAISAQQVHRPDSGGDMDLDQEEYDDDDDDDDEDSVDERTEKKMRKEAKEEHRRCFSFISKEHELYVDIIASTLGSKDHAGKTLYEIFQLKEETKVTEFRQTYESSKSAIEEAITRQKLQDAQSMLPLLQSEELFGDAEWLAERRWLTPRDMDQLQRGDIQVIGAVAKIGQCYSALYGQKFYRHPVAEVHGRGRDVLRDPTGIPVHDYFPRLWDTLKAFRDQAEGENQSKRIYWSDRPLGLTDQQWSQKMKELHRIKSVELRQEQDKVIQALPTQEERNQALSSRESQRLDDERREKELAEGLQNLEAQLQVLKQNRVQIQPRLMAVPPDVRSAQREILPYMKYWWENNENDLDNQRFTRANFLIQKATNDRRFLLAYTELLQAIKEFRRSLSKSEDAAAGVQANGQPPKSLMDLIGDAISLTNLFRKSGLDWKSVVSNDIHERFMRLVYSSDLNDISQARHQFEDAWCAPYEEQLHALEAARFAAMTFKMITDHETMPMEEALRVVIEQYRSVNDTLKPVNDLLGIPGSDHSIPVGELQAALRNRDSKDTQKRCLSAFQHKMELLQIPGYDVMKQVIQADLPAPQKLEARKQVMGLMPTIFPGDIAAHSLYPMLSSASFVSKYSSCSEQCTEMWGGTTAGRRFFINRYGPSASPIHRIERQAVAGHSWKPFDFPLSSKVGDEDNKLGHIKKYGAQHILGIMGVAFSEDIDLSAYPSPIEYLNPIYHESGTEAYIGPYKTTYVLVKWDRFLVSKTITDPNILNNYPFEYRWETRSDLRKRWHGPTNQKIYEYAKERQAEFEAWRDGRPTSVRSENSPRDGRIASLAASYRTTPPPQTSATSYRVTPSPPAINSPVRTPQQQSEVIQRTELHNNRVKFQRSDSAYASRGGSEESDFVEDVLPSVEESSQIEQAWDDIRRKYPNDRDKHRETMVLLFGERWRSIMLASIAL